MTEAPGEALRNAVKGLDPNLPGAVFRKAVFIKASEMIDLWWEEVGIPPPLGVTHEDHREIMAMSMARALSLLMTGTLAFFSDGDAKRETAISLAIIIAACEGQLGYEIIPSRALVDAVHEADSDEFETTEPA